MTNSVVIIGGGLAGIAAGAALSEAGLQVEIIEKRPMLGGRASSFFDPKTGDSTDECQHGTMRCCTNLSDLHERLGVSDKIEYHKAIHFLDREGVRSVIQGCGLPAPLHASLSFLLFKSLSLKDKLSIARGMIGMIRAKTDPKYDQKDIACWFRETNQTEQAVSRFWRPILISACNEEPERISCANGFKIFRDGFLSHPEAFHFGIPKVPLGILHTQPAIRYLNERGGKVRLKTIVEKVHFDEGRISAVSLQTGERLQADVYISALQFDLLLKLLPTDLKKGIPYWENMYQIELSPIAGVQIWFDREIDCPSALSLLDRKTEWIFNKTKNFSGLDESNGDDGSQELPKNLIASPGTHLSMVLSASRPYAKMPKEELLALVLKDVEEALPEAKGALVRHSQIVRWPKATLSPMPGLDALRPDQRSPISNLYVAGEWTRTGWPSTMEGAVRSGYLAAERLLEDFGTPRQILVPDLPESWLFRLLKG